MNRKNKSLVEAAEFELQARPNCACERSSAPCNALSAVGWEWRMATGVALRFSSRWGVR